MAKSPGVTFTSGRCHCGFRAVSVEEVRGFYSELLKRKHIHVFHGLLISEREAIDRSIKNCTVGTRINCYPSSGYSGESIEKKTPMLFHV